MKARDRTVVGFATLPARDFPIPCARAGDDPDLGGATLSLDVERSQGGEVRALDDLSDDRLEIRLGSPVTTYSSFTK
jgi:hypothetical protein